MSLLADHYETVRDRHGYDRVEGIEALSGLDRRFVAVDGRETVAAATDRPTVVCVGVGMTGPPHLGTVGQILTGIELQAAGFDVQFVVADLEPYHGGADLARVRRLAERYRAFALDLGFDPDRGVLRTQEEAREVMHTAQILAPYYRPEEWDDQEDASGGEDPPPTDWERAVADLYEAGTDENAVRADGPTSEAASVHSTVLHGVDFLHPLYAQDYEQVVVALGVDEHGLTPWARRFRDAAPVSGPVAGLHTRMVPGFDGPKMSKSVDAGVSLDAAPGTIRERVRTASGGDTGADDADGTDPASSTVFQAMCLASRYDRARLDRLAAACRNGGESWRQARREYAEYVAGLAERWQATA